jgi:Carboxypeptidase regulatory-like domain/TonB dependent receptor-like, beta-barrel
MARPIGIRRWLFLLAGIFAAAPLWADGSLFGTLNGRVRDESGGALPGATIELTSAEKGLRRSAVSDAAGAFNFALLPPGNYTVKATLASFETFESANNVVTSEKTTTVTMSLKLAATAETVTVLGDVPLVDKTNVSDTTRVESSLSDTLAIPRGYQTLIEFAPGLNDADADGNTNSHGAIDGSNLFLFDGVDTTDPTTGTFGANNNFDTIQEVVVSNSAISAEYGRAQGAVVNVITKSGTNIFHGTARTVVTNDNWNEQNKGSSPSGAPFQRDKLNHNVYDYLFTLGGPAWKDHIWFFGAYERNPQFTPPAQVAISDFNPPPLSGQSYSASREYVAWQGKLTGQLTPSHALTFSAQADPFTGIIRNYWNEFGLPAAELQALTNQSQSDDCPWACIWQVRYTGIFGANVSVEGTYAQQRGGIQVNNEFPSGTFDGSPIFNKAEGYFYNGNPFDGFVQRPRDQANLAVNLYNQLFGHSHQFKVGVDYQKIKSDSSFIYPGNQSFQVSGFDAATRTMILEPGDYWLKGVPPEQSVSSGKIYGIYGLDRFEATDRLSFNLGVRVDVQDGESDLRQAVVSATTVSPRVTGTYDIFGNGKTLASVAYGQYRDFLVQSIIDSIYSGVPQQTNFDLYVWNGSDWEFAYPIRAPGNNQAVNTDLKPSNVHEINISLQQQIGNTVAVGVRGIYRKWTNLIDDARVFDSGVKFQTPVNFTDGELKRYYKAIELTAEKRFAKNWQILASYTLSRAEGNHESQFASQLFDYAGDTCNVAAVQDSSGNIVVPAISGDCAQILSNNRRGLLSYDATHLVKVFAAYTMPFSIVNVTAAPSFTFSSGLPYQAQQAFQIHGDTDAYYYTQKGSSRLPNWYALNFALAADFKLFGPLQLGIKGEVLNLTNQQQQVAIGGASLLPNNNFGLPRSRNDLLVPRNYQFSAYLRF